MTAYRCDVYSGYEYRLVDKLFIVVETAVSAWDLINV
jgi:hypothetical protein